MGAIGLYEGSVGKNYIHLSEAYKQLALHYQSVGKHGDALSFIQKSIASLLPDYDNEDYHHNPTKLFSLSDNQLLQHFKLKAEL